VRAGRTGALQPQPRTPQRKPVDPGMRVRSDLKGPVDPAARGAAPVRGVLRPDMGAVRELRHRAPGGRALCPVTPRAVCFGQG